jgi:hypothetical protein
MNDMSNFPFKILRARKKRAKVQKKMHIRKYRALFYKKTIDCNLFCTIFIPLWELAHSSEDESCTTGVAGFLIKSASEV